MTSIEKALVEERSRLLSYFRSYGLANEAEDLYQELALIAFRSKPRQEEKTTTWLFGIARNLARKSFQVRRLDSLTEDIVDASSLEKQIEDRALQEWLSRLTGRLDAEARQVVDLHYRQGIELTEVAAEMGVSSNAMSARLMRARRKLLETLSAEERVFLASYGIPLFQVNSTRIWCPRCGVANLFLSPPDSANRSEVRCPSCELFLAEGALARAFSGTPKVSIGRFIRFARKNSESYRNSCPHHCQRCSKLGRMVFDVSQCRLSFECEYCQSAFAHSVWELAISHPEGHEFWRQHRRIREVHSEGTYRLETVDNNQIGIDFASESRKGLEVIQMQS